MGWRAKITIVFIISVMYSLIATWFYYSPARNEPNIGVSFLGLFMYFTVLTFLIWIVGILYLQNIDKAAEAVLIAVLTLPIGVLVMLFVAFAFGGLKLYNLYDVEFFFLSFVPFIFAGKAVENKVTSKQLALSFICGVVAFTWGSVTW